MVAKAKEVAKMIEDWFVVSGFLFLAWIFLSWIDVILHNMNPEPVYQAWNFFVLMF